MKHITQEWVDKAEGNWHGAEQLRRRRERSDFSPICFQAHECAQKYLKARLVEKEIAFVKTEDDLLLLLKLTLQVEPQWSSLQQFTESLSPYTEEYLYPGKSATKAEAKQAIKDCHEIRAAVRTAFGLPL